MSGEGGALLHPGPARLLVDATQLRPAVLSPPPSKSDAHRAFALSWMLGLPAPNLASWPTDVRRICDGLQRLGTGQVIDCGDGAAPFRILLALAAVQAGRRVFTGTARLAERPHGPLLEALREAGAVVQTGAPWPLTLDAVPLTAQVFRVAGALSSQYASALTLAACRAVLRTRRRFDVELIGPTSSRGYLDLTLRWVRRAGFEIAETADRVSVLGHGPVEALPVVPPDWSSLGYLLLMAAASGARVAAPGAGEHPDRALLGHLSAAGLSVVQQDGVFRVAGRPSAPLDAVVSSAPDLAPTLAALALASPGTSVLREVEVLRHKESDRLEGILAMARAMGAVAALHGDSLRLSAAPVLPAVFQLDCRDDHRMTLSAVAAACLLRCRAELTHPRGVEKSFPGFYEQASAIGVQLQS